MQRVAGRGWAQMSPRVGEARLARGRDSVGAGWGSGGAGERASVDAMRRRGQREGGGKSPIGAHPDRNGRRGGWLGAVDAMQAAKRDACKTAAMNAGEMAGGRRPRRAQARWQGGAHAASRPGPRRRAQSPFGRTACRMPLSHGAKPVPPDRRLLPRKGRAALATSSRHA